MVNGGAVTFNSLFSKVWVADHIKHKYVKTETYATWLNILPRIDLHHRVLLLTTRLLSAVFNIDFDNCLDGFYHMIITSSLQSKQTVWDCYVGYPAHNNHIRSNIIIIASWIIQYFNDLKRKKCKTSNSKGTGEGKSAS